MILKLNKISTISSTVIKVCLDSNVLLSAFIFHGKPAKIFDLAVDKKIISVISPEILAEVAKVFSKKFDQNDELIKKQIKTMRDVSQLVIPRQKIKALKYSPDNKILEAALEGQVDYIVSGDKKHLLPLKAFKGIPIVTPDQFLKEII